MAKYRRQIYTLPENLERNKYIIAKYIVQSDAPDFWKLAADIAIEQTSGSWLDVPGEKNELVEEHCGRVVNVFAVPDVTFGETSGMRTFIIELAFPTINYTIQIPMMLSSVIGNISMMGTLKLIDLEFPKSWLEGMPGPQFGVPGIRKLLDVYDRPLLNNMIKPCTGLTPKETADLFYEAAVGGTDIVKDDELIADTSYSSVEERVKLCMQMEKRVFEKTGERTLFTVNITDNPSRSIELAKIAIESGANALMLNHLTAGYGLLHELAEDKSINVPILAHTNFVGAYSWSEKSGMSAHLSLAKLSRISGADIVVYPAPYGKIPHTIESYVKTGYTMQQPMANLKPTWPLVGGGVQPGMVDLLMRDLGNDLVLGVGAGIHAHPMGPRAGAMAMRQAIDAALTGQPIKDACKEHKELDTCIAEWGITGEKDIYGLSKQAPKRV
jgi:2,3-diketo-5-methylthiopentyl-1-phosphate enolase